MMTLLPSSIRLRRSARRLFGWRTLRKAQLTAMRALLRGRDALVVLPTGAGKSAVYQVPATLLSGPTIVISPLLALQQDQLTNLNDRGDPRLAAVRVSSAETPSGRVPPGSCSSRRNSSPTRSGWPRSARCARRWSPSTRRTASRRGATISGRTTCPSAT